MKKLKKLLCSVLALSMFPMTGIMHASAEYEFPLPENKYKATGWSINSIVNNNIDSPISDTHIFGEATKAEKAGGDYSWHISYPHEVIANTCLWSNVSITKTLSAGKYYLSMDTKGMANSVNFNFEWSKVISGIPASSEWKKFETIVDLSANIGWLKIIANGMTDLYIDNIQIYAVKETDEAEDEVADFTVNGVGYTKKVGDSENYVKNGDIEDVSIIKPSTKYNLVDTEKGAYTNSDWSIIKGRPEIDTEKCYMHPTRNYARTGNYGWYARFEPDTSLKGNNFIIYQSPVNAWLKNGTYTLQFWAKTDYTGGGMKVGIEGNVKDLNNFKIVDIDDNGWLCYSAEFTVSGTDTKNGETGKNSRFWIMPETSTPIDIVFDDMVIYNNADTTKTNLIPAGSFENSTEILVDDDSQNYRTAFWQRYNGCADVNESEDYANPTKKYARNGEYGLYIKSTNCNDSNNKQFIMQSPFRVTLTANTSYTLEVWAKSNISGDKVYIDLEGRALGINFSNNGLKAGKTDENGWTCYSKTFTVSSDKNAPIWIYVGNIGDMVLDDLCLYKTDDVNKTNMIKDGGFENVIALPENEAKAENWSGSTPGLENLSDYWKNFAYAEPTTTEKYSDNYSMHLAYPAYYWGATKGNTYLLMSQSVDLPQGTYYVSYMKKGAGIQTRVRTEWSGTIDAGTTYEIGGWEKVESIITTTGKASWVGITSDNGINMYIDDFEVYAVEKENAGEDLSLTNYKKVGENLIKNGGFENVIQNVVDVKLSATPVMTAGTLDVAWVNPNKNNIAGIAIYANGEEVAKDAVIDKSANAANSVMVNGLTNGQETEIELVLTFANGKTASFKATGTPDNFGENVHFGSWTYIRKDGTHGDAVIDTNEKYTGNASLRVDMNRPELVGDNYVRVASNNFTLTVGEKYKLHFKYKAEDINIFNIAFNGDLESQDWVSKNVIYENNTTTDGWTDATIEYSPVDEENEEEDFTTQIVFCIEKGTGSLWIDDVTVSIADNYGDVTNLQVIEDSGFEFADLAISEASYNLVAEDGTKTPITALQAGNVEVTSKIKNNAKGDSFKAALIVALYNGKALVDVSVCEKAVAQKAVGYPADEFSANVTVPAGEGYSLKVMWWNGLDSLTPLRATDGI